MLDWMIQVFRVLKKSTLITYLMAVSLLDKYYKAQKDHEEKEDKNDLHLTGLTCIFIASKLEDVIPIHMH